MVLLTCPDRNGSGESKTLHALKIGAGFLVRALYQAKEQTAKDIAVELATREAVRLPNGEMLSDGMDVAQVAAAIANAGGVPDITTLYCATCKGDGEIAWERGLAVGIPYMLCLVDGLSPHEEGKYHAYFTTIPIAKQTGDDWDDAPYHSNAGTPYNDHCDEEDGVKVISTHPIGRCTIDLGRSYLRVPAFADEGGYWSVDRINQKEIPWLTTRNNGWGAGIDIWAGTDYPQFRKQLTERGAVCGELEAWP